MTRRSSLLLAYLVVLACLTRESQAAFLQTSISGSLIIEWVSSEAAPAYTEFGLGTPTTDSQPFERNVALIRDGTALITGVSVNKGLVPAGTPLDFYMYDIFQGTYWAFTSNLDDAPTPSDLVAFTDDDNSLGLGGSVIEVLGTDDWMLHLDGAASICCDDDDNDFVVRVHVVPVPSAALLLVSAGLPLVGVRRALSRRRLPVTYVLGIRCYPSVRKGTDTRRGNVGPCLPSRLRAVVRAS